MQHVATHKIQFDPADHLDAALTASGADGIYLYRVTRSNTSLALLSFRGLAPGARQSSYVLPDEVIQVDTGAWQDARLKHFSEFVENQFDSGISIPFANGVLNAGWLASNGFGHEQEAALLNLQAPLENFLLKAELQKVTERLAVRKHIERAKGIIQARNGWTEEEAYLHLRRLSRQTRTPMGEIARSMIASGGS